MHERYKTGRLRIRFNKLLDDVDYLMSKLRQKEAHPKSGHWIHRATCSADAGSGTTIACVLDDGRSITVSCDIHGGSALNSAVPRLEDGDSLKVYNNKGTWRAIAEFQASEDCS